MILRALKAEGRRRLEEAGIEDVSTEAALYARLVTGYDSSGQIIHSEEEVSEEASLRYLECIERRISGVPSAYITGEREFYGRVFRVNENVLIPRSDTETLAEEGISFMRDHKEGLLLDLCTGSGCVGITVAAETGCRVVLSDISRAALEVAKENAGRLIPGQAELVQGNLFSALEGRTFSAIVTNPPYLTATWYQETEKEVKKEPIAAFPGGGHDGLDLIRRIIASAPSFLEKDGLLALECDFRQCHECATVMQSSGFCDIRVIRDLSGRERVVRGVINA